MAEIKNMGIFLIVVGIIELVLGAIAVITGIVSMCKFHGPPATTIGIWALYYAAPGILTILTAFKKDSLVIKGFALAANVVGVILACIIIIFGVLFWKVFIGFSSCRDLNTDYDSDPECSCFSFFAITTYSASCSDLKTVKDFIFVVTIVSGVQLIACFAGSVCGCVVACCLPNEPVVGIDSVDGVSPGAVTLTSKTTSPNGPSSPNDQLTYGQPMTQDQPLAYGYPIVNGYLPADGYPAPVNRNHLANGYPLANRHPPAIGYPTTIQQDDPPAHLAA